MSQPSDPVPQRISDADRDQAATYLREALAEGRLDAEEFDERLGKALSAKTSDDLTPLFRDLPGPKPAAGTPPNGSPGLAPTWQQAASADRGQEVAVPTGAAVPAGRGENKALAVIASVAWPAVIILCFATHWQFWWLMFLPVMVSAMAGNSHHRNRRR